MKAMLTAFVAIALISVGSNYVLRNAGFSSEDRGAGSAVRLDN